MKITTKYQGPTNDKGSRVFARISGKGLRYQLSMPYRYDLNVLDNHEYAMHLLCQRIHDKLGLRLVCQESESYESNYWETMQGSGQIYHMTLA